MGADALYPARGIGAAEMQGRLIAWADERDLTRSTRPACGHTLRGRSILGLYAEEHLKLCTAAVLGDRPALFEEDQPAVLVTALWTFRSGGSRRAVEARLRQYAQHFSLSVWLGVPRHRLDFRGGGSSPVLFCRPADGDRLPDKGQLR
jgi:hypothetical protein